MMGAKADEKEVKIKRNKTRGFDPWVAKTIQRTLFRALDDPKTDP